MEGLPWSGSLHDKISQDHQLLLPQRLYCLQLYLSDLSAPEFIRFPVSKMATPHAVAQEFVQFYYNEFDKGKEARVAWSNLVYTEVSKLTFESTEHTGKAAIAEKLGGLPFEQVKHQVSTLDVQLTHHNDIVILVTGQLLVDEEQRPMNFSQVFQLAKDGERWYAVNDIFKLVLG
ncbi:hypothetical protein RB601_009661 [Gaeumannomyces tritici]